MFSKIILCVCISLASLGLVHGQKEKERKITQPGGTKKVAVKGQNPETTANTNRVKKVMIVDFDARGINKWWQGNWDIGGLLANSLVGPMSRTTSFEIIERSRMQDIFNEQELSESERFKPSNVTKIGRLLGADLILFGYLTDFSREKKNKFVYKEVNAKISFSVRLVEVATGKVVNSAEITYRSPKQKETPLLGGNEDLNPNDPEFLQSMFGQAISEASRMTVEKLSGEAADNSGIASNTPSKNNLVAPSATSSNTPLDGIIIDVTGKKVVINKGSDHGVAPGQFFAVLKVIKEVKDPKTGKVVFKKTDEVARIKITTVQSAAAEGDIISGAETALTAGVEVERVAN